ncbi:MAG TPA: molybdenum cofactor guanylyltransferase [Flavobacteriales bacterium]|nr:molybdenum cofactor guanylyltransferase [Flavobacteriales bacterium]
MSRKHWTGAVLAGGRSSRMGRNKALMPFEGRTLLERALDRLRPHVDQLIVIGEPALYGHLHDHVIADDIPGNGPMGGLATALRHARHGSVVILGCDMPRVNDALLITLKKGLTKELDAFVPACDGNIEPLVAAYHERCLPVFEACIAEGRVKMTDGLDRVRTRYMQICPGEDGWPKDLYRNLNVPGDL